MQISLILRGNAAQAGHRPRELKAAHMLLIWIVAAVVWLFARLGIA